MLGNQAMSILVIFNLFAAPAKEKKIQLGTGPKNVQYTLRQLCAKFGAFVRSV